MSNFTDDYQSLFDVKIARSDEDLKKVHQLRYEVYVKERQWEPENDSGLEVDPFDTDAHHLLMTFKPLGLPIGTARLILPNQSNLNKSYPMQRVCFHAQSLDRHWVSSHPEFSRFAISKQARENCLDYAKESFQEFDLKYLFSRALSFGLIAKMTEHLRRHRFEGICAILERPLIRLLTSNGLSVHTLGKPVEYHGLRQPCFIQVHRLKEMIHKPESDLAQLIMTLCGKNMSANDTKMSHKDAWLN